MQLSIQTALEFAKKRLSSPSGSAGLDAQVLLAHILGKPRAWVLTHPATPLTAEHAGQFLPALARLETGEPLPYILGRWEFFGLNFIVSPAVLIPRPETELLVEYALEWLVNHPLRRRAIDIGTGSGCIAVALASRMPDLHILAVDISLPALQVARENISHHQLAQRIALAQTDLLAGIQPRRLDRFDLIVANLPYIPEATLASLQALHYEPRIALNGGAAGTDLMERLLREIPRVITRGGLLLLEIEATIGPAIIRLIQTHLPGTNPKVLPDLAGYDRLVVVHN